VLLFCFPYALASEWSCLRTNETLVGGWNNILGFDRM